MKTPAMMLIHVVIAYTATKAMMIGKPAGASVKKNPMISMHGDKNIDKRMVPNNHLSVFFDGTSKWK